MHDQPLLLLDVDGVCCPIGGGPGDPMCETVAGGFPITYSERLPEYLRTLAQHFVLTWATSWGEEANRSLSPLFGLPELPTVPFRMTGGQIGRTWKLGDVEAFVKARPMAWLDDELGNDAHRWASARVAPTALIDINPAWGIAAAHVDELISFSIRLREEAT